MTLSLEHATAFASVILAGARVLIDKGGHDDIPTETIVKGVAKQVWDSYDGKISYAEHELALCIALGALSRRSSVEMAERDLDHWIVLLPTGE